MKKNIFFRADGNSQMGLGHVIRSLALAEILKDNFHVTFLIQAPGNYLREQVLLVCDELIELTGSTEYKAEAQFVTTLMESNDVVVLDGYAFDNDYQRILKEKEVNIICIDDIYSTHFLADAIINHTGGIPVTKYDAAYYTRFFLGSDYALLRLPFLKIASGKRAIREIETVFVNFGGADPNNYTCRIVKDLVTMDRYAKINLVIGAAFQHKIELNNLLDQPSAKNVIVHESMDVHQMMEIMQQSQIAICAASTVSYEYCCIGGGLQVIKTADNQEDCYRYLLDHHLGQAYSVENLKRFTIAELNEMVAIQKKYFNGKSIQHLKNVFNYFLVKDEIAVRKALPSDAEIYFEWANDPEARKNSIHKSSIEWPSHQAWFSHKVVNPESLLFIFSMKTGLIGQVRFDHIGDYWLISFSVAKEFRGQGLAEIIVYQSMLEIKKEVNIPFQLKAQVQVDNFPSINVFQHLGFIEGADEVINGSLFRNFYKSAR